MKEQHNCSTCTRNVNASVPLAVHENLRAQSNVDKRRLIIVIIILIIALIGTNLAWIIYGNGFQDISVEQEVDTGSGNAFVVGNGDLNYGEDQTESQSENP